MQEKNSNVWQEGLNEAQLAAVSSRLPYALVLAGAGSGKTRVLIARLLYLLSERGYGPAQVLALTFTNKAAGEMRSRLAAAFPWANHVWMGTFHGIAHRLLRLHAKEANLPASFTVIDSEDQQRLCKRILREREIDEKVLSSKTLAYLISKEKDAGRRAIDVATTYGDLPWVSLYEAYEQQCQASALVDFGELLLRSYELLLKHPALLAHYQGRFREILVDEFQDTNRLQYQWLKLLAGEGCGLFVVGDDDQSIYGWRGAEVANIRDFTETMLPCEVVRLEQNYRSTQAILSAANAVIANNTGRMGKALWSAQGMGDQVGHYAAINEFDEARYLAQEIRRWQQAGGALSAVAVLYRSNHQSRVLEQVFLREGIPYKVTGGMRFFERAEVKDALAYTRLLLNPQDDAAFARVINTPTRGIGEKSLQKIQMVAQQQGLGLLDALRVMVRQGGLSGKALQGGQSFVVLFDQWQLLRAGAIASLMTRIIQDSGLWDFYGQDGLTGEGRQENLTELINAAAQYAVDDDVVEDFAITDPLLLFLAQTALDAGERNEAKQDQVQLMTIHAAKGLEFDWVAVTGLEEGIFPLSRALEDEAGLSEERRLMYVAMTRAKEKLLLTSCSMRRFHGAESLMQVSRFVQEIPKELLQSVGGYQSTGYTNVRQSRDSHDLAEPAMPATSDVPFPKGSKVVHQRFGEGLVIAVDGLGEDGRVQVRFCDATRWLLLSVAKLEKWESD
ncbi:MAG: UvrD-helicase domain-containing protein [Thiotrichales bacterium]|jgi:DNA helicase-2/ATP-dependent DNA helicase PcrA|nr:UvrD-helicase domain-containing protein [Thiotrichales bacterium]